MGYHWSLQEVAEQREDRVEALEMTTLCSEERDGDGMRERERRRERARGEAGRTRGWRMCDDRRYAQCTFQCFVVSHEDIRP